MAGFIGGSAYAMSKEIADGYHLVSERTFKAMSRPDLDKLAFELDRHLKTVRGEQPPLDDLPAVQKRQRRIARIRSALLMLRSYKQRTQPRVLPKPAAHGGRTRR
jgi:hypothetical protein